MPVSLSITVRGIDELQARLDKINPKRNSAPIRRAMINCAELTQKIAAKEMIIQGSRFRGPKGKRGGKGKLRSAGVHPTKLTSRTGTLRRSIRVNQSPLPFAIEVGSDLVYARVHELSDKYPRPFLAPGLDKAAKSFERFFIREIEKELS
jgi:hypothetical protein